MDISPSRLRRAHPIVVACLAAAIGIPALAALAALADGDASGTTEAAAETLEVAAPVTTVAPTAPPTTAVAPQPVTTTTTTPHPAEDFDAWYATLDEAQQVGFVLLSLDDDERSRWMAFTAPAPPPAPEPAPAPAPAEVVPVAEAQGPAVPAVPAGSVWDQLAQCEANGNWSINTGNGYHGGLQFSPTTWTAMGGGEFATYAYQATREQQIVVGERTLAAQGWGAWPGCTRKLGLR